MAYAANIRRGGDLIERAQGLAPWLIMLVMAYPLLLWPLLEAPVVPVNADLMPAAPDKPGILNRIFFPPLMLAGVTVLLLQLRAQAVNIMRPAILLTGLYVVWAAATTLWGVEPDVTLRRSLLQVTIVGATLLPALAARDPRAVFDNLFWLLVLVAIVNVGAVLLKPPSPIGHMGIYAHKNALGGVAATVFIFALFKIFCGRGIARFIAMTTCAVAAFLLFMSQSKTSLGLSVLLPLLAFATCIATRITRISPAILVPTGIGAVYVLYLIGVETYLWDFDAVATFFFGDPTLTQRTEIWDFALKMIERRPWLGYGYEAFWGVSFESPSMREGPGFIAKMPHAHNGFIDLVIHTGFVGLGIVVAALLALLHAAGQFAQRSILFCTILLALILSCIFYNITETTFFRSFDLQHLLFLVVVGMTASAQDLIEERGRD